MLDEESHPTPEVLAALAVFPLPNVVLLPGMVLPLNVFEPRYLALVDHVRRRGGFLGIPLLCRDGDPDEPFEPVFGLGRIVAHQRLPDGRRFVRVEGLGRVRALGELDSRLPFRRVRARMLDEAPARQPRLRAILDAQLERIAGTLPREDADVVRCVLQIGDDRVFAYAVTAIMPALGLALPDTDLRAQHGRCGHLDLQQQCLAADTTDDRLRLLIARTATITDVLGESGRFPRVMLN